MRRLIVRSATAMVALAAFASSPAMMPRAAAHGDAHGGHAAAATAPGYAAGEPGDAGKPFRTVEIVMKEGDGSMAFAPNRLETKRGEQIKLVIRNQGQLEHELLIDSFANNARHKAEMEMHPDMNHAEPNGIRLKPGASREMIWRFSKGGTFELACLIPGHYEAGMKGVVVVR